MPYRIAHRNGKYCVVRPGGKAVGCHTTEDGANAQLRALYANEPGIREKAPNYSARAGETIAGNLVRGADGKFASGGGGGSSSSGGGKPRRTRKPKQTPEEQEATRQQNREQALSQLRNKPNKAALDALDAFNRGEDADPEMLQALADETGLVEKGEDGTYRMTPSGRQLLRALDKGDARGAEDAMSKGRDRAARTDERNTKRQAREQRRAEVEKRREERKRQAEEKKPKAGRGGGGGGGKPTESLNLSESARSAARRAASGESLSAAEENELIGSGLARRDRNGKLILTVTGNAASRKKETSLVVYKQADGRYRWITQSSNAYRDRDREIVSTKALEQDCVRADTDGNYGPLRWWHMPGIDIGDCDFNAMHGRILIESGTFRSEAIAERVKEAAPNLQISIGFHHAENEPDSDGVFHTIRRFERSLVPAGRASNPYTRLVVKENTHMFKEKIAQLKALLGNEDLVQAVIGQAETTQKEADAAGVAYKATDEVVAEMIPETDAKAPPEEGMEIEAEVEDTGGSYVGDMTPDEFMAMLSSALTQALTPLVGAMNMETKMRGMMDELKSAFGGYTAQKDASEAEQVERVTQLETALKEALDIQSQIATELAELKGDQPRAVKAFRASTSEETVISDTHRLKDVIPTSDPQQPPNFVEFFGIGKP